jgi:hypothetical protein
MLEWAEDFLGGVGSFLSDPFGTVAGWTFEKVTKGIYQWLARGLVMLIEWVWQVLDAGTTPRLTEDWFANELTGQIAGLALAVTIAMLLASAMQAALAGRPGQITDSLAAAVRAILASAVTVTVVDLTIGIVDEASASIWEGSRGDLVSMIENLLRVATANGPLVTSFVGPFALLFGLLGLLGLVVSMLMRSALIYLVAALAPLVWSSSVLPIMRDSSRRLVHLLVALVVSKLAIVISLVVAVQLASNVTGDSDTSRPDLDAAAAVGQLLTGFACFLVASVSPVVLYRLMPTIEGAVASAGVVGGWGRAATSVGQAALMGKGFGAAAAATKAVAGQQGVTGAGAGADAATPAVTGLAAATAASRNAPGSSGPGTGSGKNRGAQATSTGGPSTTLKSSQGATTSPGASSATPDPGTTPERSGTGAGPRPSPQTPSSGTASKATPPGTGRPAGAQPPTSGDVKGGES